MVHPSVGDESTGSAHVQDRLGELVDGIAADVGLSGVIRVDLDGRLAVQRANGLAHRGLGVPTTVDTQLAIASGTKGLTAPGVGDPGGRWWRGREDAEAFPFGGESANHLGVGRGRHQLAVSQGADERGDVSGRRHDGAGGAGSGLECVIRRPVGVDTGQRS